VKTSKTQKPQKLPRSLWDFGTKRKVVGKGRFGLIDFLPEVRKLF
jgi:hypothetical protein